MKDSAPIASAEISAKKEAAHYSAPAGKNDWLLWQLADSAFPTGGFAHSGGLEAAWQHGEVRNSAELQGFIEASLGQLGRGALPFMLAVYDEPSEFRKLDQLCQAFLSNHVANRASRLQGQALLAAAERIFALPALKNLRSASEKEPAHFHLATVFGALVRFLEIEREPASKLFFFWHLRGLAGSAVRLGIIGPMEAQALQHRCAERAEAVRLRCENLSIEDVAQTAPLLEIWQGAQDRLYSRLFQS